MADTTKSVAFAADPNIHPSRMNHFVPPKTEPKKPKEKTVAKKRYLAKKARRHKVLAKAKKASAPKNKEYIPVDGEAAPIPPTTPAPAAQQNSSLSSNAEAGPSRLPAPIVSPAEETETGTKEKKRKRKEKEEEPEDMIIDEAAEREKRKREKREKRASRDHEEKRRKKEEKTRARALKAKAEETGPSTAEGDRAEMDDSAEVVPEARANGHAEKVEETEEAIKDDEEDENAATSQAAKEPSPPPLQAFPLPTPAAAPDPALLSRQGLPENLANATLIDQNLKVNLEDISTGVEGKKGLEPWMVKHLKQIGVEQLFAVQSAMLPHLLPLPLVPGPFEPLRDYLISAPTGSGKTLAYAIPIVNILKQRQVTRLRALIVLPTRDLVVQVRETMEALSKGTGLIIGTATGQHSFAHEQAQLVAEREDRLLGGSSKVDILIATPGRLIDHLTQTPNFTLQHLRFLVIDEADRLLNQSFHNWLQQVLSHTRPPTEPVELPADFERKPWDIVATEWQVAYNGIDTSSEWYRPPRSTCQKLLFSATLTRDPAAIASLNLRDPQYFIVQDSEVFDSVTLGESFTLPSTLEERYLALPPHLKPLNLIHLLHGADFGVRSGLVFTKSVESVHRLVSLLSSFEEEFASKPQIVVKGYTSEMRPSERKSLLSAFGRGEINLLVCSDVIARGVDLPSVEHVISYDTPVDLRKYVHRVGRTARAGRSGTAWTLVEKQEARHFKGMMAAAGRAKKVKKIKVKEEDLSPYREAYERALEKVKEVYVRHA